jgi:hypothetical protein
VAVLPFAPRDDTETLIRTAIRDRRLVAFDLRGLFRRAEPHDYGVVGGVTKLFFYQIGGRSASGAPVGWRWAVVDEIRNLRVLDEHFAGARDTATRRHVQWDVLVASVSRPVGR